MKKLFFYIGFILTTLIVLTSPTHVFAQSLDLSAPGTSFKIVVCDVIGIIGLVIPILYFLAFTFFFWGLSKFILMAGNEKELQTGKSYMLWGILALFILLSVSAIVTLVTNEFFTASQVSGYPYLPGTGNAGAGCTLNPNTSSGIVTSPVQ